MPETLPSTRPTCRDGLVEVPTEDGPALYACLGPCCAQRREAARAERAAAATAAQPFARIPDAPSDDPF